MTLRNISHLLQYLLVRAFICIVQAVRMETCERFADFLATLCTTIIPIRRMLVDDNLRHAFPDLTEHRRRKLAKRMWKHLFLLVAEVAHAPRKIHETNWRDYVQLRDSALLARMLLDDRPLLLISGHFGNFELAGFILGILGFPTYSVARPLDNPYLHAFVGRFRGATGQHILPMKECYDDILAVLARGGTMGFLADQYAGSKGCWVDFFGRPVSAHKAIALFSLTHEAPMVVGYTYRRGKPLHYQMAVAGVADPKKLDSEVTAGVKPLTQWYTSRIEGFVREMPDQYWWLHNRWKDKRRRNQPREGRQAA
ncbi:MAG: lysophospholipid acyltransferase family protein [Planctomycetia bacterium]|nr:lysophospholipid acyltransferase family protein [Planctomycetia bacterium]